MISFGFSYKKSTQALNYLASQNGGSIDKLKALKLIYLADRFHLRKYGRTITNDEYYAMKLGPVASGSKDILEVSTFLDEDERNYVQNYLLSIPNTAFVKSVKEVDKDELSESDQEALAYVWDKVGRMNALELCNLTHQFPEWKKFEAHLNAGLVTRMKMELEDFFEPSNVNNAENFFPLTEEEKKDKIEYFKELNRLESLWN